MMHAALRVVTAGVMSVMGVAVSAHANPESQALIERGFSLAYNLDHDAAISVLHEAVAADPEDPAAHRSVATVSWLHILFQRNRVLVDDYLGGITKRVKIEDPPADLADVFRIAADRALELAEQWVDDRPNDPDAHYELGAIVGLMASYSATVNGELMAGLRAASRAFDEHEKVLELAPERKDAALIVGTYRYVVSAPPFVLRIMAYLVGFGGGKEEELALVEQAAEEVGAKGTEAKFALILLYNREKRYDEAQRVLEELQQQYPKNRLLWLEAGSTLLRAERAAEADAVLADGFAILDRDPRARMYGEEALWQLKRGVAKVHLERWSQARPELEAAAAADAYEWIRGRALVELGKLADVDGNRDEARRLYEEAIDRCKSGRDKECEETAKQLRKSAYQPNADG